MTPATKDRIIRPPLLQPRLASKQMNYAELTKFIADSDLRKLRMTADRFKILTPGNKKILTRKSIFSPGENVYRLSP